MKKVATKTKANMSKILWVVLAIVLALSVFAACGNGDGDGDGDPNDQPPATVTCTVTFDSQGGSAVDSQTVAIGGKVTKPADPEKPGYTFQGWASFPNVDDISATTPWDFANNVVSGDMTLYAVWKAVPKTTADLAAAIASAKANAIGVELDYSIGEHRSRWLLRIVGEDYTLSREYVTDEGRELYYLIKDGFYYVENLETYCRRSNEEVKDFVEGGYVDWVHWLNKLPAATEFALGDELSTFNVTKGNYFYEVTITDGKITRFRVVETGDLFLTYDLYYTDTFEFPAVPDTTSWARSYFVYTDEESASFSGKVKTGSTDSTITKEALLDAFDVPGWDLTIYTDAARNTEMGESLTLSDDTTVYLKYTEAAGDSAAVFRALKNTGELADYAIEITELSSNDDLVTKCIVENGIPMSYYEYIKKAQNIDINTQAWWEGTDFLYVFPDGGAYQKLTGYSDYGNSDKVQTIEELLAGFFGHCLFYATYIENPGMEGYYLTDYAGYDIEVWTEEGVITRVIFKNGTFATTAVAIYTDISDINIPERAYEVKFVFEDESESVSFLNVLEPSVENIGDDKVKVARYFTDAGFENEIEVPYTLSADIVLYVTYVEVSIDEYVSSAIMNTEYNYGAYLTRKHGDDSIIFVFDPINGALEVFSASDMTVYYNGWLYQASDMDNFVKVTKKAMTWDEMVAYLDIKTVADLVGMLPSSGYGINDGMFTAGGFVLDISGGSTPYIAGIADGLHEYEISKEWEFIKSLIENGGLEDYINQLESEDPQVLHRITVLSGDDGEYESFEFFSMLDGQGVLMHSVDIKAPSYPATFLSFELVSGTPVVWEQPIVGDAVYKVVWQPIIGDSGYGIETLVSGAVANLLAGDMIVLYNVDDMDKALNGEANSFMYYDDLNELHFNYDFTFYKDGYYYNATEGNKWLTLGWAAFREVPPVKNQRLVFGNFAAEGWVFSDGWYVNESTGDRLQLVFKNGGYTVQTGFLTTDQGKVLVTLDPNHETVLAAGAVIDARIAAGSW